MSLGAYRALVIGVAVFGAAAAVAATLKDVPSRFGGIGG